jgi:hypothetical protein
MAKDIGHVIAQFNRIVTKSQASMEKSLMLALQELPPEKQIRELKKVANEMDRIHKAAAQLAVTRGVAETKRERERRLMASTQTRSIVEKKAPPKPRRKVYRANVDTIGLNVSQFDQQAPWEKSVDPRTLYKKGTRAYR